MYQFDNAFNLLHQNPTSIAEELRDLPVPASKALWEAKERGVWEREYDRHLTTWGDKGEVSMLELWRPLEDTEEAVLVERKKRVEKWVESVDEFGMTLFAVAGHTHGC